MRADDFFPAATERMKGKLYGIAWFTQGKELFYNASLLAEAGAPSPRQLEKEGQVDLGRPPGRGPQGDPLGRQPDHRLRL